MFKICDQCEQFAQWKIIIPTGERKFLCGTHRHELVSGLEGEQLKKTKVYFCGAVPIQHASS